MADFDCVIRLNLRSQVELANLALSHIAIAGGAADGEHRRHARHWCDQCQCALSKAGVAQLARNLEAELGPQNVRVNAFALGLIAAELSGHQSANEVFMARRMQMPSVPPRTGGGGGARPRNSLLAMRQALLPDRRWWSMVGRWSPMAAESR